MASKQITYLLSISSSKFESPEISPKNPPASPKVWFDLDLSSPYPRPQIGKEESPVALPKLQPLVATVCNLRELQPRFGSPNLRIRNSHMTRGDCICIPGNSAGDLFGMVKT